MSCSCPEEYFLSAQLCWGFEYGVKMNRETVGFFGASKEEGFQGSAGDASRRTWGDFCEALKSSALDVVKWSVYWSRIYKCVWRWIQRSSKGSSKRLDQNIRKMIHNILAAYIFEASGTQRTFWAVCVLVSMTPTLGLLVVKLVIILVSRQPQSVGV